MTKVFTTLLAVLFISTLLAQTKKQNIQIGNSATSSWIKDIPAEDLIKWRRHIHQNAELSFKEENTSTYVENILRDLGNIEIKKPAKTSVIGILKGAKPGKTIGFRADMDALPIHEETGLPFASKNSAVSH
ncbi:MAG TPA: hypothetical protein VLC28_04960, partial [Flavitalea sp.]|nr:hypothetical protein [Flavitalea sp.]